MKKQMTSFLAGLFALFIVAVLFTAVSALDALTPGLPGEVVQADNVLGTLATGLIIARALQLVFTRRPILKRVSLDLTDGTVVKQGQEVMSRVHSVPAVNDFGTGAVDRADVDVPVTIDQLKEVHHKFTFAELNATDRNLVDESAEPLAVAIGNHFVDAIAALWTVANFPKNADPVVTKESVEAVDDCSYQTAVAIRKILNQRGVTPDRFLAVNSDVYEKLLVDPLIVSQQNNAQQKAIEDGMVPNIAGFKGIFEYPDLPAADNLIGFGGGKDSTVLATRIPSDPRKLLPNVPFSGVLRPMVEPTTGLTVLVNEYIDQDTLSANVRIIFAYGAAKGNANNGQRLVSEATA